jgi:cytochrome c biogenesis protein CcmG/thiol:disulfide interchange protein DsbE
MGRGASEAIRCCAGILLVIASLLLLAGCGARSTQPKAGDPAPPFTAARLDGSQLYFPDDYRGRVVALRFWADWCPYCKDEMRDLQAVYTRERDAGLVILAVNVGQSAEVARRFARSLGITYEVALDQDAEVSGRYGVVGLPLTYFVDRGGRVRGKILGEATAETFAATAAPLLKEHPP